MKIERFIGGMLESNGYVIYQKDGANCYVIDPGYHAGVFEECIDHHQLHLSGEPSSKSVRPISTLNIVSPVNTTLLFSEK